MSIHWIRILCAFRAIVAAALAFEFIVVTGPIEAGEPAGKATQAARHCTFGDVASVLQSFYIGFTYGSDYREDIKIAGLGGAVHCQYRLFAPTKPSNGEPWTFCEQDIFIGGIVYMVPYQALGISREFAIDEMLENRESTLFFGPADGDLADQSLIRIANKDYASPLSGNIVYTQEAFITQQEPGIYLSAWTVYDLGLQTAAADVYIEIVDHAEHLLRVADGTWRNW